MKRRSVIPLILLLLAGCSVRPQVVGWAERVDALRRQADQQIAAGELGEAEATLRRILELPSPGEHTQAEQLVQDTRFALGGIELVRGDPTAALAQADQGLALGSARTVFRANLHALRAMSLEALGRPLEAVMDYGSAMAIHKALFDEALDRHEGG